MKMKRLLWCLFIVIITAQEKHIPNVALVLQQLSDGRSFNMTCVVSETSMDSAISWITELESQAYYVKNHVSQYIPARDNSHNCDLDNENYQGCNANWIGTTGWTLQNSLKNKLGPVTDQRWEEFPIKHTTGDLNFQTLARIDNQQFKVHFSVRAQEIHLFVCDDEQLYYGNCYWIIINGWEGKKTAIRKCPAYNIPRKEGVFPNEPCKTLREYKNHPSYSILSKQEWKHFTIERKLNKIILWEIGNDTPLLSYDDLDATITTPYLIMISRKSPGYWKLHEYYYMMSTSEINGLIGPQMYTTENTFCASLFVAMCPKCSLTIDILYHNSVRFEILNTVLITPKMGMTWQEQKITAELIPQKTYLRLNVSLHCNGCKAPFWALDKFQICSKNEIRTLSITQNRDPISCQAIRYQHQQLSYKSVEPDKASETTCPNGTFGKDCIECIKVFGSEITNCEKSIICEFDSDQQNICQCANGYTGEKCLQKCPDGCYGFNCKKTCGHCSYPPCDYITGHCPVGQCVHNFTGLQCKTAPLPVLLNPPTIFEVKHTSFKVQVKNASYEGLGTPLYYVIQYKEPLQREWTSTNHYHIGYTDPIEVNNLNVLTKYIVRVVLIAENGQMYNSENVVPKVDLQTTCAFIEEKDITKQVYNTSATLIFVNTPESCKQQDYQLSLEQSKGRIIPKELSFEITNLKPVTEYSITIRNKYSDKILKVGFKTQEGASSKVLNLKTLKNNVTSVIVSWDPPKNTNGDIRYYKIQYMHLRHLGCPEQTYENDQNLLQEETTTTTTLKNLAAYSKYSVKVWAFTVMDGESASTTTTTKQTDEPEKTELPSIRNTEAGSTDVNIFLQQPDCTLIKGPVQYYVTLQCSNDWCGQSFITKNIKSISQQSLKVPGLFPYSNYKLEVKIGRLNGNIFNGDGMTAFFNTTSSVPNRISDVIVYSRTEASISLRFPPPFPPTGEISDYYVTYYYTKPGKWAWSEDIAVGNNQMFYPATCKIWKSMHCIVLTKLDSHQLYEILIKAKNIGTEYNQHTEIHAKTEQGTPDPPGNISAAWDDYYNLTVTWNHPSITNGPLTKFSISIHSDTDHCYESEFTVNEESYNLTYNYLIPFTGSCYSSKLRVYVAAFNSISGSSAKVDDIFSPPKTPSFPTAPSVQDAGNTTITIKLPKPIDIENNSWMYIIVSALNGESTLDDNTETFKKIWNKTNIPKQSSAWIVAEYDLKTADIPGTFPRTFIIGNDTRSNSTRLAEELFNKPLPVSANYTITILLINEFQSMERYNTYRIPAHTYGMKKPEEQIHSPNYALFALLLLLILPIVLVWILIRRNKETKMSITWGAILGMTNSSTRNALNPDVIPLTTNREIKPTPPVKPSQVRPKRQEPGDILSTKSIESSENDMFSKRVKITEFEKYVKESIESGELEKQHEMFPRGLIKPAHYGQLPQNKSKNRYNNLTACKCCSLAEVVQLTADLQYISCILFFQLLDDHTRVKLAKINNDKFSDYINANFIKGYNTKNAYIATQGPKVATVNDFWRMIWQENVGYIIMLANVIEGGKKKTEQYWPNVNEFLEFGKIRVEYVSSQVFADYEYRTFLVSCENVERKVEQLHFTSWPDHGVPLYPQSLVPFLRKLLTIPQGSSPMVVHCSAGVGRTGTIILCDLCLRMAAREGAVDVLKHQYNLREQRANLVDNIEQYKLTHLLLLECLIAPQSSITCDENMEATILRLLESGGLKDQMEYLNNTAWQDQAMRPPVEATTNPEWASKNRFQDIAPCGYGRIYLSRYPVTDEHSDYINAVEVDGFRSPQRFIVTQQPLPHTVSDFWRMVDEKEVTTIVSLNKIDKGDTTSCIFWPTSKVSEIEPVPYIKLEYHNRSNNEYYSTITIHLYNNKDQKTIKRTVYVIALNGWLADRLLPQTEESLIKIWEETEKLSRGNSPIVVTCYDGAKACGIFLALSFIVEKMKLEQQCDVCLAVRNIRPNRKQFVTEIEQFEFLYRAALKYLSSFDLYSNFTPTTKK